jgi:hypothetical protein
MEKESMFWHFQINQKNEKKTFITIKTTLVIEGIIKHEVVEGVTFCKH